MSYTVEGLLSWDLKRAIFFLQEQIDRKPVAIIFDRTRCPYHIYLNIKSSWNFSVHFKLLSSRAMSNSRAQRSKSSDLDGPSRRFKWEYSNTSVNICREERFLLWLAISCRIAMPQVSLYMYNRRVQRIWSRALPNLGILVAGYLRQYGRPYLKTKNIFKTRAANNDYHYGLL